MKIYKTKIRPLTPFATPLKGDTLFGHICWGILYLYGEDFLEKVLKDYEEKPFLVVSDGFLEDHLLKPLFPKEILQETQEGMKKEYKKRIWVDVKDVLKGDFSKAKKEEDVEFKKSVFEVKNKINHKTFTTGEGFGPFLVDSIMYLKDIDIYLLINDYEDEIKKAFNLVSKLGYGKDASIGKGRFEIIFYEEIKFKKNKFFMALSDFVKTDIDGIIYYDVITKFPKTRGDLSNPFKNPLLMAKVGAGIRLDKEENLFYIGKAIKGFSNDPKIVHQGYAITFPIGVENG